MNAINEGFVYKYFTPMNGEVQLVGRKMSMIIIQSFGIFDRRIKKIFQVKRYGERPGRNHYLTTKYV